MRRRQGFSGEVALTRNDWARVAKIARRKQREWQVRAGEPGADVADCVMEAQSARYRAVLYVISGRKEQRHETQVRSA